MSARFTVPSSKLQAPSSKLQAPSSKLQAPSSKLQAPSSKLQAPSSKGANHLYLRRRKVFLFALTIMLFMLPAALPVLAQCADDECPTTEWSPIVSYPVSFNVYGACPGCSGRIYIKVRNCGGSCDLFIEKIEIDDPYCFCSAGDIFKSAIADLFLSHLGQIPSHCQPAPGQCVANWRVLIGGCYELITPLTSPPFYQHCPTGADIEDCCISQYRICKDPNGVVSFQEIGETVIAYECPYPCVSYCGYTPRYDPISNKISLPQDSPEITKTTVIPNPTNGVTIIRCTAVETPEAIIEIADNQGGIVAKKSATTTKEKTLEFEIDAKAMVAGSYQYRILSGQQQIAVGSFTVIH